MMNLLITSIMKSCFSRSLPYASNCSEDPYWDDVVLMMHFDEDGFIDETGKSVTAYGNAAVTSNQAKFGGKAAYFDGTGDYLTTPYTTDFDLGSNDFTIEWWEYRTSATGSVLRRDNTNNYTSFHLGYADSGESKVLMTSNGSSWDIVNGLSFGTISLNTWVHYAVVRSGINISLFKNGILANSTTSSAALWSGSSSSNPVFIGANQSNTFAGYLDELRITKGVARYSSNPTKLLSHFDSMITQTGFDDVAGNTISLVGSPTINTSEKQVGISSLYLNGSSYLSTPYSKTKFDWDSSDYTIEFWIKPTAWISWAYSAVIAHGDPSSGAIYWTLGPNAYRNIVFYYYSTVGVNGDPVGTSFTSNALLNLNEWTHVVFIRNTDGQLKFFINGVLDNTTTHIGTTYPRTSESYPLLIGNIVGYKQSGYLDEIRISKGIVRYTANFTPSTQPFANDAYTKLLLHFDGISGGAGSIIPEETGKTLTPAGNTTIIDTRSKFGGYSAYFDGDGDYITVPASTDFAFGTGDFTIECWVWKSEDGRDGDDNILDTSGISSYATGGWFISLSSTGLSFVCDYPALYITVSTTVNDSIWHHWVIQRYNNIFTIFKDGNLIYNNTHSSKNIAAGNSLFIGCNGRNYQGILLNPFKGYLDELRITKGLARYSASGDVLLMHMEGTPETVVIDESSASMTVLGNPQPAISATQKKFGTSSVYLNGTSAYLQVTGSSNLSFTGDFTVEFWFRTETYGNYECLFNLNTYQDGIQVRFGGTGDGVYINGSNRCLIQPYTTLNTWQHFALQRSGVNMTLFVDGTSRANFNVSGTINSVNGHLQFGSVTGSQLYKGYFDEIRVSKGVARYTANFTPSDVPFVGDGYTVVLAHFDSDFTYTIATSRIVPATFPEESGKSITVYGNAAISATQSKFGGYSAYFDGSSALQITNTSGMDLSTQDFTLETWIYLGQQNFPSGGTIFANISSGFTKGFFIQVNRTSGLTYNDRAIYLAHSSPSFAAYSTRTQFSINTWYHLAFVRKEGVLKIFIDGSLDSSHNCTINFTTDTLASVGSVCTGYTGGTPGYNFNGYIDELRITNGIAHYTANFTPPTQAFTYVPYTVKDSDGNLLPLTQAFTYEGSILSESNPIPPVAKFPSCRTIIEILGKGYFGGSTADIDGIDFTNEAAINPSATLSISRYHLTGIASSLKGYWVGGAASDNVGHIDGIDFTNEAAINPLASINTSRYGLAGVSSTTKGYVAGGYGLSSPGVQSVIEAFTFANETCSGNNWNLQVAAWLMAGVSSTTKGYYAGYAGIEYMLYSNETVVRLSISLNTVRSHLAGIASSTRAYFGGGYVGAASMEIDGMIFATETIINPSASLSSARYQLASVNSKNKGYFGGGYTGSESLSSIEGFDFTTELCSTTSAVLSVARNAFAGVSYKSN